MGKVFVGIDCGGSSCRVLAVDADGGVLFQGQAGAANLVTTPEPRLRKNLASASEGCPSATAVCGCFAGLVNEELRRKGEGLLRELYPGAAVRAEADYAAAYYASEAGTDVCVIAGTGSLVCSRVGDRIVKSGGRGYILGDFGSGYHFGRDALLHYLDHPADASKRVRQAVEEAFRTTDEGQIVAAVYRSQTPAGLLAKLAKPLGLDAQAGERYALESIERNFSLLVPIVVKHVHEHLPDGHKLAVSLSGGVWRSNIVFRDHFASLLTEALPRRIVFVERLRRPPLFGAVELAKETAVPE